MIGKGVKTGAVLKTETACVDSFDSKNNFFNPLEALPTLGLIDKP